MLPRRKMNNSSATQNSPENISKSTEFILSSIRDPHNPTNCGTCLGGAFVESAAAERAVLHRERAIKQSKPDPKFWDGILAFLLLKRTDKQLEKLLTRLSECSCPKGDLTVGRYHKKGLEWARTPMARMHMEEGNSGEFASNRCAFIIDVFCVLSSVVHNSGFKSFVKRTSRSWPHEPTDLIPYGADSFIESMLQWYRFIPDTIIFHVTGLVLRTCRTLVIPSLVKYRFSHPVVESCRQLVDLTMADMTEGLDEKGRTRLAQRFRFRISDYAAYFRNILELNKTKPDCYAELMRGCETKVMQLCSIILYLSSDPKMPSHKIPPHIVNEFVLFGQTLFRFFYMHLYPRPDIPVHPAVEHLDSSKFPSRAIWRDPAHTALMSIHIFCTDRVCSAYKCTNSFPSAGEDFQRCSRCKIVSYCGHECKTKAWKDPKFPHRQICYALCSLMNRGGGSTLFYGDGTSSSEILANMAKILANWNKAVVHEDEFILIDDWFKNITENRGYSMPDGTEWTPGYDDYNGIIANLSMKGRGPKAKFLNRLARWPSEVDKEERLLKAQAFFGEDIVC